VTAILKGNVGPQGIGGACFWLFLVLKKSQNHALIEGDYGRIGKKGAKVKFLSI
jgi:hypothetical protein